MNPTGPREVGIPLCPGRFYLSELLSIDRNGPDAGSHERIDNAPGCRHSFWHLPMGLGDAQERHLDKGPSH